mgnify:CR=1 FL=1
MFTIKDWNLQRYGTSEYNQTASLTEQKDNFNRGAQPVQHRAVLAGDSDSGTCDLACGIVVGDIGVSTSDSSRGPIDLGDMRPRVHFVSKAPVINDVTPETGIQSGQINTLTAPIDGIILTGNVNVVKGYDSLIVLTTKGLDTNVHGGDGAAGNLNDSAATGPCCYSVHDCRRWYLYGRCECHQLQV